MYEAHFNLQRKPFELLPNPEFLYLSRSHKKALTYLDYGIRERFGFILLTGQVGTGKTTLIRELIDRHMQRAVVAHIFHTKAASRQLMAMINEELGLNTLNKDKPALLRELHDFLISQYSKRQPVVLIIDEAQNLSQEVLEDIRMLSNLETKNDKLLHIILVGQPELRQTLACHELLQLRQRIQINCKIDPLSADEMENYILHRLTAAGNREALQFSAECFPTIHEYTKGIPRLINILCDFLLLDAFANNTTTVADDDIHEIAKDISFHSQYWECNDSTKSQDAVCFPSNAKQHQKTSRKLHDYLTNLNKRMQHLEAAAVEHDRSINTELREVFQTINARLEHLGHAVAGLESRVNIMLEPASAAPEAAASKTPPQGGTWFRRHFLRNS